MSYDRFFDSIVSMQIRVENKNINHLTDFGGSDTLKKSKSYDVHDFYQMHRLANCLHQNERTS